MPKKMPQMLTFMTPFPYHIDADAPLHEAQAMMKQHDIHHLPVMEAGNLETIISAQDIARAAPIGHNLKEDNLLVRDVCPTRAYIADVADPADRILEVMSQKHIGAVIVTKEGDLAGIFTDMDACRLLANMLKEHYGPYDGEDEAA